MHRIDAEGHVLGLFDDGNPQTGQEATVVDADWLNGVQETIIDVLTYAGIAPVKGDDTQLRDAIIALLAGVVGTGGGSVPTTRLVSAGGLVTGGGALAADLTLSVAKASAGEVLAGTEDGKAVTPLGLTSAFARSLASSGYITIPFGGGLIVQWMATTVPGNSTTNLTLPTTFPTACYGAIVNGGAAAFDSKDNPPFANGWGVSTITVFNDINATTAVFVVAIGK